MSVLSYHCQFVTGHCSVLQSQEAVSAYFTSKQILPLGFAEQCLSNESHTISGLSFVPVWTSRHGSIPGVTDPDKPLILTCKINDDTVNLYYLQNDTLPHSCSNVCDVGLTMSQFIVYRLIFCYDQVSTEVLKINNKILGYPYTHSSVSVSQRSPQCTKFMARVVI